MLFELLGELILNIIIALLPIISVFIILFLFKKTSLHAGVIALIFTYVIVSFVPSFVLKQTEIFHSIVKGALISSIAAYVLFFGIFLFNLMKKSGAIDSIAGYISESTNNEVLQVIILVLGFSPLIESTSGFGTAFLVVTPILIALGFKPFKAVIIGLVSLLAVPWGALATGTLIGAQLVNIPLKQLGIGSAIISFPIFLYFTMVAVYIAGGSKALKSNFGKTILFSTVFGVAILVFNAYVNVELAGVLTALLVTTIGLIYIKLSSNKQSSISKSEVSVTTSEENNNKLDFFVILKLMSPYLFLTTVIFLSRLIPRLKELLETHFVISLPQYNFKMAVIYEPGFWLFLSSIFMVIVFKINFLVIKNSLIATIKQWFPFILSTVAFVSLAEIMASAGMTKSIAMFSEEIFGVFFIFISPFIGALGGFLTGSNTGSNAMFIKLQVQTAKELGVSSSLLAYSQITGSSHSTMAAPSRVMLGANLAGIKEKENKILKYMSLIIFGAILIIMVMVAGWYFIL